MPPDVLGGLVGLITGLCFVLLAPRTAALHPALRHPYMIHWLVLTPLIGLHGGAWLLDALDADGLWLPVVHGGVIAAGMGAYAHLAAVMAGNHRGPCRRAALLAATVAALVLMPRPVHAGLMAAVLAAAGLMAWTWGMPRADDDQSLAPATAADNVMTFMVMNAAIALGLTPLIVVVIWYAGTGEGMPAAMTDAVNATVVHRLAGGAVLALAAVAGLFAWRGPARGVAWWAAAIALGTVAALAGQTEPRAATMALACAVPLTFGAAALLAHGPRRQRIWQAPTALAAGASLGAQLLAATELHVAMIALVIIEATALFVLWLVAYLVGAYRAGKGR